MTTAREIMSGGAECASVNDTLVDAAKKLRDLRVGALPICGDDSVEEALRTMSEHGVRRLSVIDGHDLMGVLSQADVRRHLPEDLVGDLVQAISSAPSSR